MLHFNRPLYGTFFFPHHSFQLLPIAISFTLLQFQRSLEHQMEYCANYFIHFSVIYHAQKIPINSAKPNKDNKKKREREKERDGTSE